MNFSIAMIMNALQAELTLLFGYSNKVSMKKTIKNKH